jgi:hypothetical protein
MGIFETLTQYGALGIITLGLGAVLWFLLKRQIASEDMLKNKVDELQKELNDYINEDSEKLKEVINNNTNALRDLKDVILGGSRSSRSKKE